MLPSAGHQYVDLTDVRSLMKPNDHSMMLSALFATWFETTVSSTVVVLPKLHALSQSKTLLSRFVCLAWYDEQLD